MPMRVEIARPSSFITRRSTARAIRLPAIRKPAMTTTPLSSDHRLNCALPGTRSILSSVCSMQVEPAQDLERQRHPDHECEAQLPGAHPGVRARAKRSEACMPKRTSTSTVARSLAISMSAVGRSKLREQREQPEQQHQRHERGRDDHPGNDQAPRPTPEVRARRQRAQPVLDVVGETRCQQRRHDDGDHLGHDFGRGELLENISHGWARRSALMRSGRGSARFRAA